MEYRVQVNGLGELQKGFAKAPEVTKREVTKAINSSLVHYQATAKTLAPVDTGRLRSSITLFPAKASGNRIEGSIKTGTHYAVYQELGTSRGVPARLYMKGSVDENQERTNQAFAMAAENIANEIAGGQAA